MQETQHTQQTATIIFFSSFVFFMWYLLHDSKLYFLTPILPMATIVPYANSLDPD